MLHPQKQQGVKDLPHLFHFFFQTTSDILASDSVAIFRDAIIRQAPTTPTGKKDLHLPSLGRVVSSPALVAAGSRHVESPAGSPLQTPKAWLVALYMASWYIFVSVS